MLDLIKKPGINVFREAKMLWKNFGIKVMHDPTEGGISAALYEIAGRYGIGITIDKQSLIFNQYIMKLSSMFGLSPYAIISSGCIVGIISAGESAGMIRFMRARGVKCACLLYTSPSPRDRTRSRMPSSA